MSEDLSRLLSSAAKPHIEYTGYGFYVSVSHPDIGKVRRVFSGTPDLHGRVGKHHVGFVAFLEDDQLTLETFPWDGEGLPKDFRDSDVRLTHPTI